MRVLVVTAMYPSPANPANGSFIKTQVDTLNELGVDAIPFLIAGANSKLKYLAAVPRLRRRLARGDVSLVHANYVFAGVVARLQARVPVIVTYNGSDLLGPIESFEGRHSLLGDLSAHASKLLARFVDAAIVPSSEMGALLQARTDVRVLPHGMDMDTFAPVERGEARRRLGLDPQRPYLLFAANPARKVKNYPLAQASATLLAARFPDVELLVVQDEPQERLALYFSACDALVFTSFQEGSPNIVKQAMACDLPIVSTDVGDVREMIGGTDGCRICPFDAAAFRDALAPLLESPRRTTGRAAVLHLERRAVAARVAQLYEEVIDRSKAKLRRVRPVSHR